MEDLRWTLRYFTHWNALSRFSMHFNGLFHFAWRGFHSTAILLEQIILVKRGTTVLFTDYSTLLFTMERSKMRHGCPVQLSKHTGKQGWGTEFFLSCAQGNLVVAQIVYWRKAVTLFFDSLYNPQVVALPMLFKKVALPSRIAQSRS